MSWFVYSNQQSRKKRKGIWLRVRANSNEELIKLIKKQRLLRTAEKISRIVVHELKPKNQVLLEVWAQSSLDLFRYKDRYNVFYVEVEENPNWICEGDLGKGLKLK